MSLLTLRLAHDTGVHAPSVLVGNYGFLNINFVNVPDPRPLSDPDRSPDTNYANLGCRITVKNSLGDSAFFTLLDLYTAGARTNSQLNKGFYTAYSNDDIEFYQTAIVPGRNNKERILPVPANTGDFFIPFSPTATSRYYFLICGRADGTNLFIPYDKTLIDPLNPGKIKITVSCTLMSFTQAAVAHAPTTPASSGTVSDKEIKHGPGTYIEYGSAIDIPGIKLYQMTSELSI